MGSAAIAGLTHPRCEPEVARQPVRCREPGDVANRGTDKQLQGSEDVISLVRSDLSQDWAALPEADAFAAFRQLDQDMRDRLVASAIAKSLLPMLPKSVRNPVRRTMEAEALPRLRDVWTPDEAFLSRLTKPALLSILAQDLQLVDQAAVLASAKKSEVAKHLTGLFAAPFATLTEDQRHCVMNWCPVELATLEAPALGENLPEVDVEHYDDEDDEDADGDADDEHQHDALEAA